MKIPRNKIKSKHFSGNYKSALPFSKFTIDTYEKTKREKKRVVNKQNHNDGVTHHFDVVFFFFLFEMLIKLYTVLTLFKRPREKEKTNILNGTNMNTWLFKIM